MNGFLVLMLVLVSILFFWFFIITEKTNNGYRKIRFTNFYTHRIMASIKLGRILKKEERVHHKNKNRSDNRLSNLQVFRNQREHMKHHWKEWKEKRKGRK